MEKISSFINLIQTINVTSKPCYYSWKDRSIKKWEITEDEKHLYEEVYYYVITIKKETEVRALYNETRLTLSSLSQQQLKNKHKLLQSYRYKELYNELAIFSAKHNKGDLNWEDEKRLKKALRKHLICSIPLLGKFTVRFLCGLADELQRYYKYMDALKEDIKTLLEEDEDEANALSIASKQQSKSSNPYYNLDIRMSMNNTKDINFYDILDNAFRYIDDSIGMQEYFKSENARVKAKYYYTNDRFYKDLLRVVISEREVVWLALKIFEANKKRGVSLPDLQVPELAHDLASIELFIQNINEVRFEESVQETKSLIALNNNTTLPKRVKLLFQLIEFLHSNIANFNKYNNVILDRTLLLYKTYGVGPLNSFEERFDMPIIKQSLQSKNETIYINIVEPIRSRAHSLGVCDWSETRSLWEWNIEDIEKLHENYNTQDLIIIKEYEQMYTVYRDKTNCDYGCNGFFYDLDETLMHLFSVFRDKKKEEKLIKPAQLEENKYAHYTALQWGAIIHYTHEKTLRLKKEKVDDVLSAFKKEHSIQLADTTLRTQYYEAVRKITKTFDYKSVDLEKTIPFFKEHYKNLLNKIKNEIKYTRESEEKRSDYQ